MKEKATPRPWRRGKGSQAEFIESGPSGERTQRVASIYYGSLSREEQDANANLIVTAVNAHEALVETLNGFILAIDIEFNEDPLPGSLERAYKRANAALAKVKES